LVDGEMRSLLDLSPMRKTIKDNLEVRFAAKIRQAENFDLAEVMAARHRDDERAIASTRSVLAARYGAADIHARCVALAPPFFETLLLTCKVEAVEGIAAGIVGQRQVWTGPAERDQALFSLTALAVLDASDPSVPPEPNAYRVIGWVAAEDASIGKPFLVEADGRAYLSIPMTSNGSSGASSDVVMARHDATAPWREIDAASWSSDLSHRLPRGQQASLAYTLDLLTMRAITDIARAGDPNCCPSGVWPRSAWRSGMMSSSSRAWCCGAGCPRPVQPVTGRSCGRMRNGAERRFRPWLWPLFLDWPESLSSNQRLAYRAA
jgi:hypothetical protein